MRSYFVSLFAFVFMALSCGLFFLFSRLPGNSPAPKAELAILVPAEHKAMESIISGFSKQLEQELGRESFCIRVYRSYGESALMQAAIQQIALSKAKVVLPIGTAATLLTLNQIHDRPIVHLAAKLGASERAQRQFTGVLDEVPPEVILRKALQAAAFQKITLVHSATEKAYPEAQSLQIEAKNLGVDLKVHVASNCSELFSIAKHIDPQSELILILKDHLIVSGLPCLLEAAERLKIPLMASDEDSVVNGAHMALAVKEEEIGKYGALLSASLLKGASLQELPIVEVDKPSLFFHRGSLEKINHEALLNFFMGNKEAVEVFSQEEAGSE